MNREELKQYDGREGRPTYVAVSGRVYDVSDSAMWVDGNHYEAHQAGQDLTEELKSAPHVRAVIERFPVVGHIDAPASSKEKKREVCQCCQLLSWHSLCSF